MSGSPDLQPQKRILLPEDSENLLSSSSKKPRIVEETTPQAESSSVPPNLKDSPRKDVNNTITKDIGVPVVDMRLAVDGEEDMMQTEKVDRPSSSEFGGNQSKGKKKKIRPPRVGRRSRNEEDEERGTLLLPTGEMEPKAMRLPKRLCALLLGFCGSGYRGMQMWGGSLSVSFTRDTHLLFLFLFLFPSQPGPIPLTIENVLFNALVKVGAVSQDNADNPTKVRMVIKHSRLCTKLGLPSQVGLARAARTDAGVHAAGNVVSLKLIITIPGVEDLIASINEQLPPAIRVWGYVSSWCSSF